MPRGHSARAAGRMQDAMNIGQAARATGLSARMIRHYERIGLLPRPARTLADYRSFSPDDLHRLRFIGRARSAGFSSAQTRALLDLWQDQARSASDVRRLAQAHLAEIERRVAELSAIAATLRELTVRCAGGSRPECPILEALATGQPPPSGTSRRGRRPPVTRE